MMHTAHPIVCDGKYTNASLFFDDAERCERFFLGGHRYGLIFFKQDGNECEQTMSLQSGHRDKNIPGLTRVPYDLRFSLVFVGFPVFVFGFPWFS